MSWYWGLTVKLWRKMYLQNCGLRKFSYEILTKEVFFSFSISSCLRLVNFLLRAQEFKQGSQNLSRYQIIFYRFVPILLYFERLAKDSVLHGTVWKSHQYRIAINTLRFRVCNHIFSCMVKLWSTYRVKVAQCMGSPLFWLVETYCTQITH